MKKLLLVTISIFVALITTAADLNPFAYVLSSSYDPSTYTLTVNYSLNAPATRVDLVILDGATAVKTISFTNSGDISAGAHTVTPSMLGLAPKAGYTWKLNVYGAAKNAMTYCKTFGNYQQFAIDIDNNTNSPHFGRILTTQPVGYDSSDGKQNAGIYEWNPVSHTGTRYSGGIGYNTTEDWYKKNHVAPHRLRIAQDGTGRIYVTACDLSLGQYLWSVDPDNLNSWTQLLTTAQMKSHHGATGNLYSCGLDIRGEGDNINLLLFSGLMNTTGEGTNTNKVYICEYNPVSKQYVRSMTPASMTRATCTQTNAQYDQFGGVWYINYNGGADYKTAETGLKHITTNGTVKSWGNTNVNFQTGSCASAGFRHNVKENKIALSQYGNGNTFAIYTLGEKANQGATISPKLYNRFTPSQSLSAVGVSSYVEDFAWDYAGNLYVCTRNKVVVYADTLSANRAVTTPAPAGNTFEVILVGTSATINTAITPENSGTVTGGGTYEVGTKITLTATPAIGYEFIKWTDKSGTQLSTSANYTFNVTNNIILTAHFREIKYNVEYFNLFLNKEDITDYFKGDAATMDNKKNTRLWRLFQVTYNETYNRANTDGGTVTQGGRPLEKVLYFVNAKAQADDFETKRNRLEDFLDNDASPKAFYWLGQYLEHVVDQDINPTNDVNVWGFYLQSFINRTKTSWNQDISENTDEGLNIVAPYKVKSFAEAGLPDYWRKWWQQVDLGLDTTTTFQTAMRKSWNMRTPPQGSITTTNSGTLTPGNWYKWNNQEANPGKLLAWYYDDKNNPTWPTNPTIVRNVYKSGALFATWVEKLISEDKTIQNNSDAIWLLNYHNGTHDIKILRKMQGGMYNTLCLPFSATKAQQPSVLQNATIVQFTGINENLYDESGEPVVELQFTKVDDIVAGVPYLVMPQTDITSEITFTNILTGYNGSTPLVIETAQENTQPTNNGSISFIGNIHPTNIPAHSLIVVANNRLAEVTEAGEIQHMRGYFRIDDAQLQTLSEEGKVYLSMRKPTTTSVPLAPEAEQPAQPKVQKIMRNGKIYILRGEEVYDVMGHRL